MLKTLLVMLIFSVSALASIEQELAAFSHVKSTKQRLSLYSRRYLARPYGVGGPLGEGVQGRFDQDPLYRFDTFDCTTFVETVVSLARSGSSSEFETQMNEIRYEKGIVDYFNRNHFTDMQWIPNNIENGIFEDITAEISPAIEVASAEIDFGNWILHHTLASLKLPWATPEQQESRLQELHTNAVRFSPRTVSLNYISVNYLIAHPEALSNIPHGTVVNFVRPNWDLTRAAGTHQNISHQALLFRKNGVVIQRHASTSGVVQEIAFLDYLKKFENHPTLKGVHFLLVL